MQNGEKRKDGALRLRGGRFATGGGGPEGGAATERRHRAERRILLFHGSRITRSALKNARKGLLMTVPDERHEVIGGMSRSPSSSPPCSQGHGPDRPRRQLHPECSTLALASLAGSRSERMRGQAVRGPTHRSQTSNHGKNREE
jgi:hypothetical protein